MKGTIKIKFITARNGAPQRVRRRCRLHEIDPDTVAEALADFIKELGAAPGASARLAAKIFLLVSEKIPSSFRSKNEEEDSAHE